MLVDKQRSQVEGGDVVHLTYTRPEKANALNPEGIAHLTEHFRKLAKDEHLRCVVFTGAGDRAFIAGADITALASLDPDSAREFITSLHHLLLSIRELPVPVIARINGHCLGAGMELAAACDIRIASQSAMFGMPEVQVGIPSVIEAALLPRLIGRGRAAYLVLTGETIDAGTAHSWGFMEQLVAATDLDSAVASAASFICAAGPAAIRNQKHLLAAWDEMPINDAIEHSIGVFARSYETDEPARMMQPFLKDKN